MAIFNLYSKRLKKMENSVPDVYVYDEIPDKLRQQVWYIFQDSAIYTHQNIHQKICDVLCREYGKSKLVEEYYSYSPFQALNLFLMEYADYLEALDVIELITIMITKNIHDENDKKRELIHELNERFKENGVGYQFEGGQIIRLDSTYMHSQVVKPTINLLWNETFKGACDEYLKAHNYYKDGDNKGCLSECLKAFESTMKIICKEKGWNYNETDQAKKLIAVCFDNELIPNYMRNQFNSLQSVLESGVPTNRNKNSGHGQGSEIKEIPSSLARYTLNLTGSNIIFLIEQSNL